MANELKFGKIQNPFRKKKEFVFGRDRIIPERKRTMTEEELQRDEWLAMQERDREKGYQKPPEQYIPPPPEPLEPTEIERPPEPEEIDYPTYTPGSVKEALVHGLMGFIPGFHKGFYDSEAKAIQEEQDRADQRMKLYEQAVDMAIATGNIRGLEQYRSRMLEQNHQNMLIRARNNEITQMARIQANTLAHQDRVNKVYNDFRGMLRIFDMFPNMPTETRGALVMKQLGIDSAAEILGAKEAISLIESSMGRKMSSKEKGMFLPQYLGGGDITETATGAGRQTEYLTRYYNWRAIPGNENKSMIDFDRELASIKPTAATRQLAETSAVIVPKIDSLLAKLQDAKYREKLGPAMGRWNEFLAGTVGAGDPDYAYLRATIGLLQTGTMRAHVGARGGQALLGKFETLMNAGKMSPESLAASLLAVRNFLADYRNFVYPEGLPWQQGQQATTSQWRIIDESTDEEGTITRILYDAASDQKVEYKSKDGGKTWSRP